MIGIKSLKEKALMQVWHEMGVPKLVKDVHENVWRIPILHPLIRLSLNLSHYRKDRL